MVRFVAYFTVCFHRPIFNCMQKQRITDQNWTIWRPGNKAMSFLCPSDSHPNFLYPVFNAKVPPILIHSQTVNLILALYPGSWPTESLGMRLILSYFIEKCCVWKHTKLPQV